MADHTDQSPEPGGSRNHWLYIETQNARINSLETEVHTLRDEFRVWKEGAIAARVHMEGELNSVRDALHKLLRQFDEHVAEQRATVQRLYLMAGIFLAVQCVDPTQFLAATGIGTQLSELVGQFGRAGIALGAFWFINSKANNKGN